MRALIVRQPWAGLIAAGLKPIEFRGRRTNIRERIAVYAGQHSCRCEGCFPAAYRRCYMEFTLASDARLCLPTRAIFCLATLADCRETDHGRDMDCPGYTVPNGMFSWLLADVTPLSEPIPCKPPRGARTWFALPADVEAQVLKKTGGRAIDLQTGRRMLEGHT